MEQFRKIARRVAAGLMSAAVLMGGMISTNFGSMQANAAGPNRTATPPDGAPDTAILVEAETGNFGPDTGMAYDHDYSGTGFVSIGGSVENANVSFKIEVETAGTYEFAFNYIAGPVGGWENDRSINLKVNDSLQATETFPGTGNWDNWTYFSKELTLEAGENTVNVAGNGKSNGICIDYFYYWLTEAAAQMPELIPPHAVHMEAEEDAKLGGGAFGQTNHKGYSGSGFVAGFENNRGAYVEFTYNAEEAGDYYLSLRYANGKNWGWPDTKQIGLSINGGEITMVPFATTNAWNQWGENVVKVTLEKGENKIRYQNVEGKREGVVNIDKIAIWPHVDSPTVDTLVFENTSYSLRVGATVKPAVYAIDSNGVKKPYEGTITFRFEDDESASYNKEDGTIKALKAGEYKVYAEGPGITVAGEATLKIVANPTISVDFSSVERPVNHSQFGYILIPNYNIPDSRLTLLGPLLARDTIPAQNFQGIGDMGGYYDYEYSILPRSLQAVQRAKDAGHKYYFLLGHNPSWATASGNPTDTGKVKTPEQLARFKQYLKDTLQYYKDNGITPDFANLTNEYWTGLFPTYQVAWEAVREVYPELIPAVGPSAVGFDGIPEFYIPESSEAGITVEGPAWHEFWTGDTFISYDKLKDHVDYIATLQEKYPEANGKYIIFEENNSGGVNAGGPSGTAIDFTRSMANIIRTNIDWNIKGCLEGGNANGMSDIVTANKGKVTQNPAVRRPLWWIYYAFAKMSGDYVTVSVDAPNDRNGEFTGAASKDVNDSKVIIANSSTDGSVSVELNNQPYVGEDVQVDLYKVITSDLDGLDYPGENDGLMYQRTLAVESTENISITVDGVKANETWMVVLKKVQSAPSFFHPMTPDDGEAALTTPTLTWSKAQGATSYSVTISENKDMSDPIIKESGIKGQSFEVKNALKLGQRYYWTVSAENEYGSTGLPERVVYSFYTSNSVEVPGQFSPTMPSLGAMNEKVRPEFLWTSAYKADSYRLVVSTNKDLSDPVIDQAGITTVRGNGQFGGTSQAYYRTTAAQELSYNTTYYWTVFASNDNGERPWNGPIHSFTTKAEGDAPVDFKLTGPADGAKEISSRTVITWEASANAFFYKLEISENEDMSDPVLVRDRMIYNKYTMEPNVLKPDTTYYWRVTALTKDLKHQTASSTGIRSFKTEAVPCSPLLYSEYAEGSTVNLLFQPSKGATSYTVKYGTESGKYTKEITNVTGSPCQIKDMEDGTYYFAIVANNAEGSSVIWNERSVTVSAADDVPVLDEIVIEGPAKVKYKLNEQLDKTGLVVTAKYSDGTEKVVEDYEVDGFDSASAGEKTVTVGYEESGVTKTATFKVTIIEEVGITVTKLPDKTEYFVGEKLDQTGIQVSLKYSDNSTELLTVGYSLAQYDPNSVGKQQIRVQYMNFVAYFDVIVKERPADLALESISVKAPDKTEYFVGEKLDETGMVVTAKYSDGTSRTVSGYSVSGFDSSAAGEKTITVSYAEDGVTKTATFKVSVKEKAPEMTLASIALKGPDKTEYKVGEGLNTDGLEVTAHYSDGTSRVVSDYKITGFDSTKAGEIAVTVSYTEDGVTKTALFNVTIKENSVSSTDPGESKDPETSSGSQNSNNTQTGDGMLIPVVILGILAVVSAGLAVILGKKRKLG